MAVVKMYITKFDREVLIDDKHPLAVAELDAAREQEGDQDSGRDKHRPQMSRKQRQGR